jgi:diguanylate cyclase (GGDEF)-like protein/PAS domain S-box-containing protein
MENFRPVNLEQSSLEEYSFLDQLEEGIILLDKDFRIIYVNRALCELLGLRKQELLGNDAREVIREKIKDRFDHPNDFEKRVIDCYSNGNPVEHLICHMKSRDADGETKVLEYSSKPITSGVHKGGRIEVYKDITKEQQTRERLREMAIKDPLTGAYNRHFFNEVIDREISRSKRHNHWLSLLLIDINQLKAINDRYGHLKGDEVLRGIANLLQKNLRQIDILIRYGGDEFLVIMPQTKKEAAENVVRRLKIVEKEWIKANGMEDFEPLLSMGSSSLAPNDERGLAEILKEADERMYEHKSLTHIECKPRQRIGDILVNMGKLSRTALNEGLNIQASEGKKRLIGEILVEKGLVTKADVERALSIQRGTG